MPLVFAVNKRRCFDSSDLYRHTSLFSSMDCFRRGVKRVGPWHFLSRPSSITRQSTCALTSPTWTTADVYRTDREYLQLRLLKVCYWHHDMLPHLKGCFEFILSANSLQPLSPLLSKQDTYPKCRLSAKTLYARKFTTVTQFLVYVCK